MQSLHTMGPVVAAAFSGFGLRKLQTALGGGIGEALLKGKGSMAADIQRKALLGEKISPEEARILQTKKQITAEDLRQLAAAKALTKADLDRLYINGKIKRELYQQSLAQMQGGGSLGKRREMVLLRQQGGWWNTAKLNIMKLQLQTDAYFARLKVQVAQSSSAWAPFAAKGITAIGLVGLYKNRFVMDKITGRTYQLLTSNATTDGRRWVRTSRRLDRYSEHTTKKYGLIVGYVPYFGLLTDEGRKATWVIEVKTEKKPEAQILGTESPPAFAMVDT